MTDYSGSDKDKEQKPNPNEVAPDLQPVVTSPVQVKKKRVRIRDLFIAEDMKSVGSHVFYEMFVPYSKQMLFSLGTGAMHRALFGISTKLQGMGLPIQPPQGPVTRISYGGHVNRPQANQTMQQIMGGIGGRMAPMLESGPRRSSAQQDEYTIGSHDEAIHILTVMGDVLQNHGLVTLRQYKQLCGVMPEFTDENFGWTAIPNA